MPPTVIHDPSLRWSISWAWASDAADRPEATTTSVPVGCCNRGSAHSSTTPRTATRTAAIQRIRGRVRALRDLQRSAAITSGDAVDVGHAYIGHVRALDLDHVLGVALAAVREVEAADVDVLVGDQDLGVHEIVHGVLRVGDGPLAPESRGTDHCVEGRDLPCGARLRSPLALDFVHLRRIVHTADVDLRSLDRLRERAQNRTRSNDRRADADAFLR